MGVLECVEVLYELAESEGFEAQSHARLEAHELANQGQGFGEHQGGKDDHGGVLENLEKLVHANLGVKDRDQISYCGWKMAYGTRLIKFYELCRERGERQREGEGLNCVWLSIRYGFLYIPLCLHVCMQIHVKMMVQVLSLMKVLF